MLRNERYRGVVVWGRHQKAYRGGTKVRVPRDKCDWIRIDAPELRIVSDELWASAHARIPSREHLNGKGKVSGRKPRYMMSQLARCAECGGPVKVTNGKQGKQTIKVYMCAYRHERGSTVCSTTLRRPVDSVNGVLLDWIRANVFTEARLEITMREIRRYLEDCRQPTTTDTSALEKEAKALRAEIDRLVSAIATGAGNAEPIVKAIEERQGRLSELEVRLNTTRAAPKAIDLELRRLEAEAKKRFKNLAGAIDRNPDAARDALLALFPDKLSFRAIQTPDGPRFQIEGRAVVGKVLVSDGVRPNVASPTGFEPVLQP